MGPSATRPIDGSDADMGNAAFAVIVPTYNRSALMLRAVQSVLTQTEASFELIVVDDASTDDTPQAAATIRDPRVRVIRHTNNRGLAAARNTGIAAATAPLIAFLDDDDELLPHYLERKSACFARCGPDVGFVACGVREIDERKDPPGVEDRIPPDYPFKTFGEAYLAFLRRVPFSGWFIAARREALLRVGGFDESVRTEQDRDLLYRLVQTYRYCVVPEVLAKHYFHGGPHVNVYGPRKAAAYRHIMGKHASAISRDPDLLVAWHYKLAWLHYRAGEGALARTFALRALRTKPWHAKTWFIFLTHHFLGTAAARAHTTWSRALKRHRYFWSSKR